MSRKGRKLRAEIRKNRQVRTRDKDLTRRVDRDGLEDSEAPSSERISGKGKLTRKRTLAGGEVVEDASGLLVLPEIDPAVCRTGRVLRVEGLNSFVQDDQTADVYRCATRRLLKSLATDQRHVVAVGDRVWYRPEGKDEGIIERVEPRYGILSRTSRGRQHVLVANIDQLVIVGSAAEPKLKPHLIDRFLVTAEHNGIDPLVCINKVDLVDPTALQVLLGVYAQLGYRVLTTSAASGQGIELLRDLLSNRASVVAGQSGVGKSSLLNAIDPSLDLPVQEVSEETEKGRHTTTNASLIPLQSGGFIVDTPGIRQFALWDVIPEEVAGFFPEMRPFVSMCRYPDCTHEHETGCAVQDAVERGWIDLRRYESYLQMLHGDAA
jgi:ribosome biogenesis GTPase / thiamine phosphate phosphatase